MKSLLDWIDHRTGIRSLTREALFENIPGGSRWRYVWGSTLTFTIFVQFVTGVFLWMGYSASSGDAWESVNYIQNEMTGGWLLRGIHHWTAQFMPVLLLLHLMQVVIDGAYKAPREVNYWFGVLLLLLVLALSLTGYLLPWDQKGFWATRVATNLMNLVPFAGPEMQKLVIGGTEYGHHTLTRFFALHAGVLPGLAEERLLRASTVMEAHHVSGRLSLVRHQDPVVVVEVGRSEEIELKGSLGLTPDSLADEEEAITTVPGLGLPVALEVGIPTVDPLPAATILDHLFEDRQALEGDADRTAHAVEVHQIQDLPVEEGRIHARLQHGVGTGVSHVVEAVHHELEGPVAVMAVARSVMEVEELPGRRHGAEQRIVAARSLLVGIEADRRAFGMALGRQHRAIEVEGDAGEALAQEARQDQLSQEPTQLLHVGLPHAP